jgi:hypothetical protein
MPANTKGDLCKGRLNETLNPQTVKYQTPAPKSSQDQSNTVPLERALLGCALEHPQLRDQIKQQDLRGCFSLSDHRNIYGAIADLYGKGIEPTPELVADRSGVQYEYVTGLMYQGAVHANFTAYVRRVRELSRERLFLRLHEELGNAAIGDRSRILEQMMESTQDLADGDLQRIFHSWPEFLNAPPLEFAIDGFLQEGGSTLIAALPAQSKTLVMLAMAKALLGGERLFNYFRVLRPSKKVLYLVPESTIAPFWARIKLFRLEQYIQSGQLLVHTLSAKDRVALTDPRLLSAVQGADLFLDTVARFMTGGEDIEDARQLAESLFGLLRAGARTITAAHHSPKAFEHQDYMTLENMVRGSGDLGAAVCGAWGLRQIDAGKNRVYVKNLKPRDFEPCEPFILQGRNSLNELGCFEMTEPPMFAGELKDHLPRNKGGRPQIEGRNEKREQVLELKAEGMSEREIAVKTGIKPTSVHRLIHSQALQN